jgi:hypothetical protein
MVKYSKKHKKYKKKTRKQRGGLFGFSDAEIIKKQFNKTAKIALDKRSYLLLSILKSMCQKIEYFDTKTNQKIALEPKYERKQNNNNNINTSNYSVYKKLLNDNIYVQTNIQCKASGIKADITIDMLIDINILIDLDNTIKYYSKKNNSDSDANIVKNAKTDYNTLLAKIPEKYRNGITTY